MVFIASNLGVWLCLRGDPRKLKREKVQNPTSAKIATLENFPLYGSYVESRGSLVPSLLSRTRRERGLGKRLFARMDSLHDELSKLTSEKRKRQRKDDCLNLEKGLEQELLFLRGK